ncbi:MAG: rod-binding protein [Nitrospira sp.]|nr:rod-binding protein [Nitrospira sp.]
MVTRSGDPVLHVNLSKSKNAAEARQQMVQAGQQFEAYFISYLLKVMRETVPEGALANKQGAYFYSFYDEEIGKRAAESGGIGIAKMVQENAEQHFASSPLGHSSSFE